MSERSNREFVLVDADSDDGKAGVIMTKQDYDVLQNFTCALKTSETWGDFWAACTDATRSFIGIFLSIDEVEPRSSDLLSKLSEDVFILNDAEFPMPQMSDSEANGLGSQFLESFQLSVVRTEYGGKVCLYDVSRAREIVAAARKESVLLYRGNSEVGFVGNYGVTACVAR